MRMRSARRGLAVAMAASGAALLVVSPVVAASEVRTETDLFGFDIEANAAPVSVRFYEDFIPIPTDPGDPQLEITASHTGATLGTGPSGRAVASSIWPGAALGDGFGQVAGDESIEYPIRASARYPGGGEQDWTSQTGIDGVEKFGMYAEAKGLDITARAEGGGLPEAAEQLISYGQIRSTSTSTVEDGTAVARAVATIAEIQLLQGLVVLDNVTTELTARSDGTTASTDGRTTIGGIEVLGTSMRLTDQGVEVAPGDQPDGDEDEDDPLGGLGDLLDPVNQVIQQLTADLLADGVEDALGIRIEALQHQESIEGAIAERVAEGLKITVDLGVLRGYLDPLLDLLPIGDVLDLLPDDPDGNIQQVKGLVFELLGLAPKIEVVVGSAFVAASATPPFDMPEPPPLPETPPPPPPAAPPADSGVGGTTPPSSSGVSLPPPTSTGTGNVPSASVAPPQTDAPSVAAPTPVGDPIEPFGGVPAAAVGISLLLGAVPTFGMRSVRDAAVGLTATTDVPRPLPDLRQGA